MKTISKRDLSRKPSQLTAIQPGESVKVPDRRGHLVVSRPKKRLSLAEIEAELDRLGKGCPKIDTLEFLREGE